MPRSLQARSFFLLFVPLLILMNLTVLLNIPVLRQVSGFVFLTFVPGFLLLFILKLNRLGLVEKIVLSVGLSVAFSMLFGVAVNGLLLVFGFTKPLSTGPLLISFSIATIVLAIIAYIINKDIVFSFSALKLTTGEKAFLIVPALFPLISIVGMRVLNLTDNNVLPMVLLLTIPAYVIFISFYRSKVPQRLYPSLIYLISISLLLMVSLRSNHVIGSDIHDMYYLFQLTLQEGHWSIFIKGLIDACLSISLLPTIYQSFLDTNPEYLFKVLYALLFSISPLVVYIIAKKYIGSFYAFIGSFFFMAQFVFLWTASSSNTNLAILFFGLIIMVLFHDGVSEFAKRPLFIIFTACCVVSHYSTSYICFFVLLLTWIGMEIIPRILLRERKATTPSESPIAGSNPHDSLPDAVPPGSNVGDSKSIAIEVPQSQFKRVLTINTLGLFFVILFFWYSQITVVPFSVGVGFISNTFLNLNQWYVVEAKGPTVSAALGVGVSEVGMQARVQARVIVSWITVAFTGIGVLSTMARYRRMVAIPRTGRTKPDFLQSKFEVMYLVMAMACSAILVLAVVLPYILAGYSMERTYFQMMAVLSPFFVIGGITVARWLRARPHWIILVVLIPFFMYVTGVMYQIQGYPASIALNSSGTEYEQFYVHDQDSYAAKWIKEYAEGGVRVYPSGLRGTQLLISQGRFRPYAEVKRSFIFQYEETGDVDGYIFLRSTDITTGGVLAKYPDLFARKSKIYTAGISEIFR